MFAKSLLRQCILLACSVFARPTILSAADSDADDPSVALLPGSTSSLGHEARHEAQNVESPPDLGRRSQDLSVEPDIRLRNAYFGDAFKDKTGSRRVSRGASGTTLYPLKAVSRDPQDKGTPAAQWKFTRQLDNDNWPSPDLRRVLYIAWSEHLDEMTARRINGRYRSFFVFDVTPQGMEQMRGRMENFGRNMLRKVLSSFRLGGADARAFVTGLGGGRCVVGVDAQVSLEQAAVPPS